MSLTVTNSIIHTSLHSGLQGARKKSIMSKVHYLAKTFMEKFVSCKKVGTRKKSVISRCPLYLRSVKSRMKCISKNNLYPEKKTFEKSQRFVSKTFPVRYSSTKNLSYNIFIPISRLKWRNIGAKNRFFQG